MNGRAWLLGLAGCSALLTLAVAGSAHADSFKTGNEVYAACEDTSAPINWGFCRGYVIGTIDALIAQPAIERTKPTFCTPERATVGQMADVAISYMKEHPEERANGAASIVWVAMMTAFPCAKAKPSQR